jgi:hypothetical protein
MAMNGERSNIGKPLAFKDTHCWLKNGEISDRVKEESLECLGF